MQKGARGFLPLRLTLYHIFGRMSSLKILVYPVHGIISTPCFAQACAVRPMYPESRARVCDGIASVFALSNGFPVHYINSFPLLCLLYYHTIGRLSSIIFNF